MIETVRSIPDEELLGRAVRGARDATGRNGTNYPRWVGVSRTFSLGSTFARQLCRRYGLDPDELVHR